MKKAEARGFYSKTQGTGAVFEGIYLIDGKRTPFGKYTGSLSTISPTDLGIQSSKAVLSETGIPATEIDQTLVANIGQASADSFFLPRHIALYSGAPLASPALMVQRICGSGMELLACAAEQIALGKAKLILGCGTDTMSRFPLVSFSARQGFPLGKPQFVDMLWEALDDTAALPMGATADRLAQRYQLTREEVDFFAYTSQNRYFQAFEQGFFKKEITPMESGIFEREGLKPRKYRLNGVQKLDCDENPRQTTLEKLAKLPFVFSKEGPTTPGSASGIVDGACSALVADEEFIKTHGIKPIGKILAVSTVGVEPEMMGIGPAPAIRSALSALKMGLRDIDLFEINEAFGAQCFAVTKELELDLDKLNIHGGAIAIGHPLAATGVRLVTTCLKSLKMKNKKLGVVSACIGGGQGIAMVLEAV